MADLDFFFDPVCPWAWITSRWVVEVQGLRQYDVRWRFISLKILNQNQQADWYTAEYRRGHAAGHEALRVAAAVERDLGNAAVGALYTALGSIGHTGGRRDDFRDRTREVILEALANSGIDARFADFMLDESLDTVIAESTDLALTRTGRDVGTPILTFNPDAGEGAPTGSFFGPVIARIPRGEQALRLWDAVETLATTSGLAELKRTLRERPQFD